MIINASNRTDIPAFFSEWFFNRLDTGYVDVLNPYGEDRSFHRYQLDPSVVDAIVFTTKNPKPMLDDNRFIPMLMKYPTLFYVTVTPYNVDIEPNVPSLSESLETFARLSDTVGNNRVILRYDPILFGNGWNQKWHVKAFTDIVTYLTGYTHRVVISFVDMYAKTRTNMPFAIRPDQKMQELIVQEFADIAKTRNMELYVCHDNNPNFAKYANMTGCASIDVINEATGLRLKNKSKANARGGCDCILNADIGQYDTCRHGCLYCYACKDHTKANDLFTMHDPMSSCLIGHVTMTDKIISVKQESWKIQ